MHVYLVSRVVAGQPTEIQVNVEGIPEPQIMIPLLNRCALGHRPGKKIASAEFTINGLDCVVLSHKRSLLIAHPAFPTMHAAKMLDRLNKGEALITVLHAAQEPTLAACQESSDACVEIMRTNLERMVRRGGGLEDLLRSSSSLSSNNLQFKRRDIRSDPRCCNCVCM